MAGSVNKVILIGNLCADPEVKSFQNGGRIANLRIATNEAWKDKNTGERKEVTEWHRIVANGRLGEVCAQYLKKGSRAAGDAHENGNVGRGEVQLVNGFFEGVGGQWFISSSAARAEAKE